MKKFLEVILVAAIILLVGSTAEASKVRIYDYGVDNFINAFKRYGVAISDVEYGTKNGERYCTMNFNNNSSNMVVFWLNNDATISSAGITCPFDTLKSAGKICSIICYVIGMSEAEYEKFMSEYVADVNQHAGENYYEGSVSVWCNAAQRYIKFGFKIDQSRAYIVITAYV